MEPNDILALVKAGYTKEEISMMGNPVNEQEPVKEPEPTKEPEPAQEPEPAKEPEPAQEPQPSTSDLMKAIAKLTSAVQANAIAQSQIPDGMRNQVKAEDIMAEIIRPTYKERG